MLKTWVSRLPLKPGVYRMLDESGKPLYVGKAKALKKRVAQYTQTDRLPYRIRQMVALAASLEITVTGSEAEALLLEANLIKHLSPRYNILLKDDKSFPYLLVTLDHPFPRITKHRGKQKQKGKYFGPYASVGAVNDTLAVLQKAFLLRPCTDSYFANRKRPCLQYQIKRCSAPCTNEISHEAYGELVGQALDFLQGKSRSIQNQLQQQMETASKQMDYEAAATYRDRIHALTQVQSEQRISASAPANADLLALYREGDHCCVLTLSFQHHQYYGSRAFFPKNTADLSNSQLLINFLGQYYQTRNIPKEIILPENLEEEALLKKALSHKTGRSCQITVPSRGDKRHWMEHATKEAQQSLQRRIGEAATHLNLLKELAALFNLAEPPERIEVYDNSHIMGTDAVGAMIVVNQEGFDKASYRKFTIREPLTPGDDYGMMKEVLTRRLERLAEEPESRPSLLLIDGGTGHLTAVTGVMHRLAIDDIPYACIAKGRDRNAGKEVFHLPGTEPFSPPRTHPVMFFLQRIRDEAHRFAIGTHRARRSKKLTQSILDNIPGIGASRKRALLKHFGSASAVEQASVEDLVQVNGIYRKTAEMIYNHLHS